MLSTDDYRKHLLFLEGFVLDKLLTGEIFTQRSCKKYLERSLSKQFNAVLMTVNKFNPT